MLYINEIKSCLDLETVFYTKIVQVLKVCKKYFFVWSFYFTKEKNVRFNFDKNNQLKNQTVKHNCYFSSCVKNLLYIFDDIFLDLQ